MRLRAIHTIGVVGGYICPGDCFEIRDPDEAERLIGRGSAELAPDPLAPVGKPMDLFSVSNKLRRKDVAAEGAAGANEWPPREPRQDSPPSHPGGASIRSKDDPPY